MYLLEHDEANARLFAPAVVPNHPFANPRLFTLVRVEGCSSPSSLSLIAIVHRCISSAPSYSRAPVCWPVLSESVIVVIGLGCHRTLIFNIKSLSRPCQGLSLGAKGIEGPITQMAFAETLCTLFTGQQISGRDEGYSA
jgi:hypothetical protein